MTKRTWVVLPDQLSIRVFFDTGIVSGLRERLDGRLAAVFLVPREAAAEWVDRVPGLPVLEGDALTAVDGLPDRVLARVDASFDRRLGYHPLAIRLNYRHGFHAERMQPGHPNWMLDTDRDGPLPHRPGIDRAMERWFFGPRRHVPSRLLETMRRDCSGLVLSNVQPASAVPFLVAARRLRLPVVAHVASWDHTVGKGVISPHCGLYIVQNDVMEDDLRRYHGIAPDRVRVTGWPQTDLFHRRRPRVEYERLLRGYGLDPGRALVLVAGNTPSNAPYEGRFVERLVGWWEKAAGERFQLLFRPHPRDGGWRERFASAAARDGVVVQEASYSDLDDLATLLQHTDVVVCNAGTILLDALVGDRPAVCVLYDEGAPQGESWAAKNVVGKHYEELAASGAFYRAGCFEEVVAGIDRALEQPAELAAERRRAVEQVVGVVDGRAAERVVDAVAEGLGHPTVRVVMTLLARDEADIVDAQIAYHLNAGVDLVIATDNASNDGTAEILERYEHTGRLRLLREPGDDMRQDVWVTRMARLAATEYEADWVIHADADEFWWPRGGSLKEVLATVPRRYGVVRGCWRHFLPRPVDGSFFAERMTVRLAVPAHPGAKETIFHAHQKVAHRARRDVEVEAGNHNAEAPGLEPLRAWHPIEVLHFSFRSVTQLERKARGGWLRNRDYEPTLHQLLLDAAFRDGRMEAFYGSFAVDDDALARGLADGTLAVDTRLRDALRALSAEEGRFELRDGKGGLAFPRPSAADDAAYAAEASVLVEIDGIVRAEGRVRALEGKLGALERGPLHAVRRLARR